MDNRWALKSWEVVLIIVILFLIGSTSLYWYDRISQVKRNSVEDETRLIFEKDVRTKIDYLSERVTSFDKWQNSITEFLNVNIQSGRLLMPQKEKK